ncbi:RING-H2 finger protein ATL78-like isoform X1 [Solanum stenotomum]|uniref:RING-H2 finger protein ATL78-like isoform X1 n=1 Tax=Solanum stenotomum TaxID=172797 RepID=UPI0020D01CCA|nr:RING-H2 finger protein ATL78-like isoform X1 [Solanum stenotomum]
MATITSALLIQEFMENFHYSRRLLPESTMAPPPAAGISHYTTNHQPFGHKVNTFDANVIMVLAVLVCALICSFILNFIIKCVCRCTTLILVDSSLNHINNNPSSTKLVNGGIEKKALKTFPVITYTTELKHPGFDSECVICLSEFGIGEKIKVLPKCNHGFHVKCIDKWLNSHSSCPTCRHCLIETCQKIVPISSALVEEVVIRIEPLQREDVISNNQH